MADENGVVFLYTTEPCGFCRQAKTLLQARGVDYREVNLAKDPEGRAELVALTGQMTFPQIVVGKRSIGGFRELLEADRAGMLDELLAAERLRRSCAAAAFSVATTPLKGVSLGVGRLCPIWVHNPTHPPRHAPVVISSMP